MSSSSFECKKNTTIFCFIREIGKIRIYKSCYVFHTFDTTAIEYPLNGQVKGITSKIDEVYVIFLTKINKYMTSIQSAH